MIAMDQSAPKRAKHSGFTRVVSFFEPKSRMKQGDAGVARAFKPEVNVDGAVSGDESLCDLPQVHGIVKRHLDSKDGEGDAGDSQALHHSFKNWNADKEVLADSNVGVGAGLAVPHVVEGVVQSRQEASLEEVSIYIYIYIYMYKNKSLG
jgi:hypothetical protein